jgi:hypothetical protein
VTDPGGAIWFQPQATNAVRLTLRAGWNQVMWLGPSGTSAQAALQPILHAVTSLFVYDAGAQSFVRLWPAFAGLATRPIDTGDGLWVFVAESVSWAQPGS